MPKKLIVMLSLVCACSIAWGAEPVVEQLRKKAEAGDAEAQYNLGVVYAYGYGKGLPQDDKEAVKWYRKAADQGYAGAQYNLGQMYRIGKGVPQDYIQSYAWFNLAGANGHDDAKKAKADLANKMTPEQIARARELSRELYKKIKAAK